ncbi:MAG: sigma-54-dependent transcriptional regulator [Planctomycetota bacterium]
MVARVLVVDDEETIREELCEAIREAGYEATGAGDGLAAVQAALHQSYDVCISDIRMPGLDGIGLLKQLAEQSPETMVIMITAYGDLQTAIEAIRHGATDYVLKPLLFDDILSKVARLVDHRRLALEVRTLRRALSDSDPVSAGHMIGESAAMKSIANLIKKVAPTRSNVLITGPSGTGKELIARAIHESSDRAQAPFVPINCAAIPETLLEGELFGHMKGSFTGATHNKEGLLKAADDGTIFLDELGELPMSIQAKLLRAIESREIQPVGSVRRIPISARIIAATNKNLPDEIKAGRFREDLFYRMAVVEVQVPPLSERREDIPALVSHFVRKYSRELHRECTGVANDALAVLMGYEWRGNIRELENTIERAMILSDSNRIELRDLPDMVKNSAPVDPERCFDLARATQRFEHDHICRVIESCGGDKRVAATKLGVSLSSLYRKLDLSGRKTG